MLTPEIKLIVQSGVYFTLALVLSLAGTWVAIRVLPVLGFLDKPGGRHIHEKAVPRGGGIAVIFAFLVTFVAYMTLHGGDDGYYWKMLLPGAALVVLGIIDDRYNVRAWIKLLVQIVCAISVYWLYPVNFTIFGYTMPWVVSMLFTIAWIILIINAFNLIDGLDGLASGVSAISAVCLAVWFAVSGDRSDQLMTMLILTGCCLGFLRYNFHPAKIFLGDVGSTFIGFVFAVTGLSGTDRAATMTSLLVPLLAIGVPVFDVVLAVWRRIIRKLLDPNNRGIMEGDQDHLHHRLLRNSGDQVKTAFSLYFLALILAAMSIGFMLIKESASSVAFLLVTIGAVLAIRHLAIPEIIESARLLNSGIERPRKTVLFNVFHPLLDLMMISLALYISNRVLALPLSGAVFVGTVVPIFVVLVMCGVYRIYWLRAGIADRYHLVLLIFVGIGLSELVMYAISPEELFNMERVGILTAHTLLFALLTIFFFVAERFMVRYLESFWLYKIMLSRMLSERRSVRTVLYGGGLLCQLFVNYLYNVRFNRELHYEICGVVDDDSALKGQRVYGFPVLGKAKHLDQIYERTPFDCLIVTSHNITPESLEKVRAFCREHQVELRRFEVVDRVDA